MNGKNSGGDVFRHRQASSNSSDVRTCAVKLRPLVGEVHPARPVGRNYRTGVKFLPRAMLLAFYCTGALAYSTGAKTI